MNALMVEETKAPTVTPPMARSPDRVNRWLVAMVVALVAALAAVTAWGISRGGDTAVDPQVDRLNDAVEQAWNDADGEAMAALFTEDGVLEQYLLSPLYVSPSYVSEGRTQIRNDVNAYGGRGFRTWRVGDPNVSGPFSSVAVGWEMGSRSGSGIAVLQRTDDGLIAHQWIFSLEGPQP